MIPFMNFDSHFSELRYLFFCLKNTMTDGFSTLCIQRLPPFDDKLVWGDDQSPDGLIQDGQET